MILLTRLNGERFAVNVDLIERAETTPDTVIRMLDGSKIVVAESLDEVIDKVTVFKAAVQRLAEAQEDESAPDELRNPGVRHLHVVPPSEQDDASSSLTGGNPAGGAGDQGVEGQDPEGQGVDGQGKGKGKGDRT